jgi:hypothetical protein
VSEASSATRPLAENRSAVGAQRRPRKHDPPAGSAWRDAQALELLAGTVRREAKALKGGRNALAFLIRSRSWSVFDAYERAFPQQDFMRRFAREIWRRN